MLSPHTPVCFTKVKTAGAIRTRRSASWVDRFVMFVTARRALTQMAIAQGTIQRSTEDLGSRVVETMYVDFPTPRYSSLGRSV
jgi:hypothetical protein